MESMKNTALGTPTHSVKRCDWSERWTPVEIIHEVNGWAVELGHNPGDARPWCVQYGGNGTYFVTRADAMAYCLGRKWIKYAALYPGEEYTAPADGWEHWTSLGQRNKSIERHQNCERPYRVRSAKHTIDFKTEYEAWWFCAGRGWLPSRFDIYQDDSITDSCFDDGWDKE